MSMLIVYELKPFRPNSHVGRGTMCHNRFEKARSFVETNPTRVSRLTYASHLYINFI